MPTLPISSGPGAAVSLDSNGYLPTLDTRNIRNPKIIVVDKSGRGDFTSIAAACASLIGIASASDPYLVQVGPGIFTEPQISVPTHVAVTGSTIQPTVVEPDAANHHIFYLSAPMNEISFMTLRNAGPGYAGIAAINSGNFAQCHKISMQDCDIGLYVEGSAIDTQMWTEYLDLNGTYSYGTKVVSSGGFAAFCNNENYYTLPTSGSPTSNYATGATASLDILTGGHVGTGTDTFLLADAGATVHVKSYYANMVATGVRLSGNNTHVGISGLTFHDGGVCLYSDNVGTNASFMISGVTFFNCTTELNIDNATTTGSFTGALDYLKSTVHASSPFFITGRDVHEVIVARSGGDFTSIKDANDAIAAKVGADAPSESNPYQILVQPGVYVEQPITMQPYVTIVGNGDLYSVIVQAADNTTHLFTGASNASLAFIAIDGPTNAGQAAVYYATSGNVPFICDHVIIRKGYYGFWGDAATSRGVMHLFFCGNHYKSSQVNQFVRSTRYSNVTCMNTAFMSGPPNAVVTGYYISGPRAELTLDVCAFRNSGATGIYANDGATVRLTGTTISSASTGLQIGVDSAISSIATATTSGTGTSVVINKPTGTLQNHLMLAAITVDGGSGTTITPPAGWTLIARTDNSTTSSLITYYRVAGASEGANYTWTLGSSVFAAGGIATYDNAAVVSVVETYASNTSTSGTTHTVNSITPTAYDSLIVAAFSVAANTTLTSAFGTSRIDLSSLSKSLIVKDAIQIDTSATGSKSATSGSSTTGAHQLIAISPRITEIYAAGTVIDDEDVTTAIKIDSPCGRLAYNGVADKNTLTVTTGSKVSASFLDHTDGEEGQVILGELWLGSSTATSVPLASLTRDTAPTGWVSGGTITYGGSGLSVNVSAGTGYVNTGTGVKKVSWSAGNITLTANAFNLVYIDSTGAIVATTSDPITIIGIPVAVCFTDSSNVISISAHPVDLNQRAFKIHEYLEYVIGPIVKTGLVTSKNGNYGLDVTDGEFYVSDNFKTATASTAITWTYWYRDGSGGWSYTFSNSSINKDKYDDGSGTLATLTAGQWKKDSLYLITNGSTKEFHVIYGQETFASKTLAETGNYPTPSIEFQTEAVRLAGIVIEGAGASIASVVDARGRIGQFITGTTGVTVHNDLTGRDSVTAHTQYQLTSEKNAASGYAGLDGSTLLTASQLPVFVGDTGSGGTKGAVPAPATGDAAANKFLKASGAWATLPTSPTLTGLVAWVDSINGNDGTGVVGRLDKPYLTIQAAITAASSGDTVYVLPGTYNELITCKDGVSVKGINRASTILTRTGNLTETIVTMADTMTFEDFNIQCSPASATVTGVKFTGTSNNTSQLYRVSVSPASGNVIACEITSTGAAAEDKCCIRNCSLKGSGTGQALLVSGSGGSSEVSFSVLDGNATITDCVKVNAGATLRIVESKVGSSNVTNGLTVAATGAAVIDKGSTIYSYSNAGTLSGSGFSFPADKFNATVDPSVSDDITKGFDAGSTWINTVKQSIWKNVISTAGSAVWTRTSNEAFAIINEKLTSGEKLLGSLLSYTTESQLQGTAGAPYEIQYIKLWLIKGTVLTKMQMFSRVANGNVILGIYTDSAGAPGTKLTDTGSFLNNATGYKSVNLLAAQTISTTGFHWLAIVNDSVTARFQSTPNFPVGFLPMRREGAGSFALPATAASSAYTGPSPLLYVSIVE